MRPLLPETSPVTGRAFPGPAPGFDPMYSPTRKRLPTPLRLVPGEGRGPTVSDEQLIQAVIRGDDAVAGEIYTRLIGTVDRTLYRIFGRREDDHEDLVQISFEQIVLTLARQSYAGACSLQTWAASVTSRVAFNALRSRRRERAVLSRTSEYPTEPTSAGGHDVEGQTLARSELERLREHLVQMKPHYSQAVFLHDVLGHELAEIAVMEGVSVAAAQSRLVRGRKDLYARLGVAPATRGKS